MDNIVCCLVLKFIIAIKFRGKSLPSYIREKYGLNILKQSRLIEGALFKKRRCLLDINFLSSCLEQNVIPKFLNFKLSNQHLQNSTLRRKMQRDLLRHEINRHQRRYNFFKRRAETEISNFKQILTFLDFIWISSKWNEFIKKRLQNISNNQSRKLSRLQISNNGKSMLSPDEVIFNYSSHILSQSEKQVLTKGLNFTLSPSKIKFIDIALPIETIARRLFSYSIKNPLACLNPDCGFTWDGIKACLKDISLNSMNYFRPPTSNLTKEEMCALRSLQRRQDLIVTRPDKGNGVVLLNRTDYNEKMQTILSDSSKFSTVVYNDLCKKTISLEENFRIRLKSISADIYKKTSPTGTQPGRMYGLPKVHKSNVPLRPILSAVNTTNYSLSKFLVPHIQHLTESELVVKDVYSFSKEINSYNNDENSIMVSFDIESLFTNVPLDESIEIILKCLFPEPTSKVLDLSKQKFKELIYLATKECFFTFNNILYKQIDGVAMGNPLGPIIANAFLAYNEKIWLSNCPTDFKPVLYRRYVDDIFLIFKRQDDVDFFLRYMNSQHRNIKFVSEIESDGVLPFLGINVKHSVSGFTTTIYRKPTFTGLYTHIDSFVPNQYKSGLVNILLHRAYMICSNFQLLHQEFEQIKKILFKNGFDFSFVNNCIGRFLNKKLSNLPSTTEESEQIYVKLPFTGKHSLYIRRKIVRIVKKAFPKVDLRIAFTSLERIGTRFRIKDRFPDDIASNIIYKFQCRSCNATYFGKTRRHFTVRCCEHMGITPRMRKPSITIPKSAIFQHLVKEGHVAKDEDFSIIDFARSQEELDIKEALHIYRSKPSLNIQQDMATLTLLQ